jgi:uncharacterized protein (TIGR02646 family)
MKYIVKQAEPNALTEWKALANENWLRTYDTLSGSVKKAVKDALIAEQGGICCYCERELHDEDSHLEHFQPQHDPNVDPLDFSNLLCSCQNRLNKGEPRHCGNLKGDWFDPLLLISPLQADCASHFVYYGDGRIQANAETNLAAQTTISKLGLDIAKLNSLRKQAIEPFLDPVLSAEEFQEFVKLYLHKDNRGRFQPFWTTIAYLFGEENSGYSVPTIGHES